MDINVADRLLLGTVGWCRPDWMCGYYPEDLPPEWRLAYYANDCGCVVLPVESWCTASADGVGELEGALQEVPGHLVLFVEMPARLTASVRGRLALFPPDRTVLLAPGDAPGCEGRPVWRAQGDDTWVDTASGGRLVRWPIETFDLRELGARARGLGRDVRALVLDGPGADPGRVPELRTLLQLLGIS